MSRSVCLALLVAGACSGSGDKGSSTDGPTDQTTDSSPPDTDTGTAATCTPGIEAGTGVLAFEPLVDGGDIELVHGPQGGYHITTAVKLCGLSDAPTSVHVVMTWIDQDLVVSDVSYAKPEIPIDDCCRAATDMYAYLFIKGDDPGTALPGEQLRYRMEVTDGDGTVHVDELELTVLPAP